MPKVCRTRLAWIAGWWDGEGSIGLAITCRKKLSATGQFLGLVVQVQASTTDRLAFEAIMRLWKDLGITRPGYNYQEKKPRRHKPSYHLRMSRISDVRKFAPLMLPFAVTKKRQWELIIEWVESRLAGRELDSLGRVKRGGNTFWPFTNREIEIAVLLRELNCRGPRKPKTRQWHRRIEQLRNANKGRKVTITLRRKLRDSRATHKRSAAKSASH